VGLLEATFAAGYWSAVSGGWFGLSRRIDAKRNDPFEGLRELAARERARIDTIKDRLRTNLVASRTAAQELGIALPPLPDDPPGYDAWRPLVDELVGAWAGAGPRTRAAWSAGSAVGDLIRHWNGFILELRFLMEDPGAPDLEQEVFAAGARVASAAARVRAAAEDPAAHAALAALGALCAESAEVLADRMRADLSRHEIAELGRWCNERMDRVTRASLVALNALRDDGVAEA
jgi:hypothetical protein